MLLLYDIEGASFPGIFPVFLAPSLSFAKTIGGMVLDVIFFDTFFRSFRLDAQFTNGIERRILTRIHRYLYEYKVLRVFLDVNCSRIWLSLA